jgi:hypothetical protein
MKPNYARIATSFSRCCALVISGVIFGLAAVISTPALPPEPQQPPSDFQQPELQVEPSPGDSRKLCMPPGQALLDFAVSPAGPEVAILSHPASGRASVIIWKIASGVTETIWQSDGAFAPRALAWHPAARVLFLSGTTAAGSSIVRLDVSSSRWNAVTIFRTKLQLRRLLVGPRPFSPEYNGNAIYRLFFGIAGPNGTSLIASVTEHGDRYYEVTQTKNAPPPQSITKDEEPPKPFTAESALPEAFHPAGNILLWADRAQCFQAAHYGTNNWEKSSPVWGGKVCGGSVATTPNGIGLLHWRRATPGVELYLSSREQPTHEAAEYNFISVPLSTSDGRGLVGVTNQGNALTMVYVPIDVPLANVSNAWMFLESVHDRKLFGENAGLFRVPGDDDQLFQLYDSEAYDCGGYDPGTPTRPYLVTTDIFWENFAAAYEGLFILLERRQAIPAFWQFVHEADAALSKTGTGWEKVFHALAQVEKPGTTDLEAQRILRARGPERSSVWEDNFNYGDLAPRGHYNSSEENRRYFRAFRYLTSIASVEHGLSPADLKSLPPAAQEHARAWIRTYSAFIAPSRAPSVWSDLTGSAPPYVRHPAQLPTLFPLSFGFDNEVLLSTVFHPDWPSQDQVMGPNGKRRLPSGLDVAAALGSPLAQILLEPEVQKFPPLAKALDDLKTRAPAAHGQVPNNNLYDRWIEALGTSWADNASIPGETAKGLWDTKRLQTGLASWATLRHATVLVNERTIAECGENGFEWIKLTPPRGYVEPAPETLESIAGLFDAATNVVKTLPTLGGGQVPPLPDVAPEFDTVQNENLALREGLLRRLGEAAANARLFAGMARKELKRKRLSSDDYEKILHVGRVAEYHFLIFKSLANPDFALSNPDPMPKIADVAGGANGVPYLHSAVGAPLEWDQIVPYFGRREIVKGSVYSYYEFASPAPLDDAKWRTQLSGARRPAWVAPFMANEILSCPPKNPY